MSPEITWDPAPVVIVAGIGYAAVYMLRWRRVRAADGPRAAPVGRLLCFAGGLLAVAVALLSPIDGLGEQLASFHMVQHLLLADVAPILLILGLTRTILRPVTRRTHRIERAAGPLAHPAVGVLAYVVAMLTWHVPAMYDLTLRNATIHALEHTTFLLVGGLYWWHLLSPIRSRLRLRGMGPVLYVVSTRVAVGALGIALTFSPTAIYEGYVEQGGYWGMTPLTDLNVAGAVMALEQSLVMGVVLVVLFVRMLNESEAEQRRAERLEPAS